MSFKRNIWPEAVAPFHLFAALYILGSFFIMVLQFPVVGYKIQAAELVFPLLFFSAVLRYGKTLIPSKAGPLEIFLAGYLLINIISASASGSVSALLESLGRGYLILVFYCFYAFAARESKAAEKVIPAAFLTGALVSATAGIAGWLLASAGHPNFAVRTYVDYPYLGTLYRASGFTPGMTMLLSLLLFPLLYLWRRLLRKGRSKPVFERVALAVLLTCALLTFSKTLILLGLSFLLTWSFPHARFSRAVSMTAVIVTALLFWTGTHFIFTSDPQTADQLQSTNYSAGEILSSPGGLAVLPTSYTALKKAAWLTGSRHPLFGTGPGEFNRALPGLKAVGQFPSHLPDYDPHSTWLGAFAETGIPGLLMTILLWIYWARLFYRQRHQVLKHPVLLPIGIFLLATLIESVALDIMNFRHLWVLLGVACGWLLGKLTPSHRDSENQPINPRPPTTAGGNQPINQSTAY